MRYPPAKRTRSTQSSPHFASSIEPGDKRRVVAACLQPLGEREHRVRRFAGIDQALRQVSRVVPAAAHRDSLVAERREPVEVIDAVRARNVEPASLAVEEVERLPDGAFPNVSPIWKVRVRIAPARSRSLPGVFTSEKSIC